MGISSGSDRFLAGYFVFVSAGPFDTASSQEDRADGSVGRPEKQAGSDHDDGVGCDIA